MDTKENNSPASPRSRFEFGLRQLFYATALIAAGLALTPITIWISLAVLVVWGIAFSFPEFKYTLGLCLFGTLLLLGMLWPTQTVRGPHNRTWCMNNMKQIILGALNYESGHGHFPTDRIVTLADGTELRHSWRIAILPFIEGGSGPPFPYDFEEPWDGPNNSKLASQMPSCFACPSRDHGTKTPYKLVNGPGTAFETGKKIGYEDLADGTSNTIALIEDHANPVNWMEPSNFTAEEAAQAMNSMTKQTAAHGQESFFTKTYAGSNYAKVDGSTWRWAARPDRLMDPGAFLIADGYLFDRDASGQSIVEIKYGVCFTLAIYLILILLPVFFLRRTRRGQIRQGSEVTPGHA